MYSKELNSIKKSNRLRTREIFDESLVDLASNDYLGLTTNKQLFEDAYKRVLKENYTGPKSSQLVNGYNSIHKEFEQMLCKANKFEAAITVGSGFLANLSMIEALVRKGDRLFIDSDYHASGILATKLLEKNQVILFDHNNIEDLKNKYKEFSGPKRNIIAIEGVYSMQGDLAKKEFFNFADEKNALLIVDEAHSSGVLGENLLGIFDYYKIKPKENHIKMGTLGKAYGSYGAYILASSHIIEYLQNRAKAIIYTTAPSLFDISLALQSLKYILANQKLIKSKISENLNIVKDILDINSNSLIIPIEINDNKKVVEIQEELKQKGFLVGAIRQPTVKSAIIRLIAKVDIDTKDLISVCKFLKEKR
ncbi:pyridoxal phosphate-dependent aminotransferase family protein [Arcobacter sp. CECT 8985]|uniref:aminotransferase class I/II-fold pyridoxal phosphate-dependent enzyme n=1 Tax=Arcobacter sp. CECT 8985 TaxID=1935424 RepID=UPI00100A7F7F|nr:pyridoxal phosphate-dependent aminotransferase family protein [Arcobacter sp. CECT 8985]RXJ87727.1 8-amino-7-oxononanoate synthase [Arcobacter sp. CECT 8985]